MCMLKINITKLILLIFKFKQYNSFSLIFETIFTIRLMFKIFFIISLPTINNIEVKNFDLLFE